MWDRCLKRLEAEIPESEINIWIKPLDVVVESNQVSLLATNDVVLDRVNSHYFKSLNAAIKEIFGTDFSVKTALKKSHIVSIHHDDEPKSTKKIASNLDPRFTFDNFIEGRSNTIALAAAMQTAQTSNPEYNPLFLYGSTGLGKTHLLHSIGNEILKSNPDEVVCYLHSEVYVNEMVKALQQKKMESFKQKYRSVTTLLIDDIQFFAGKERTQEEFFHNFNYLYEGQKRIIITCDRYPKKISIMSRLKSRLGWGVVVPIDPPDYETRVVILKEKAKQFGVDIDDDVAFYIAKQLNSNIRELEGALNTLKANATFTGHKIDLHYTKQILKELFKVNHQIVSVENIQKVTAQYYNVKLSELIGKSRKRSIVRPRQLAMFLAKELTDNSYPEIAEVFGGRDHTTVIHACKKVNELLAESTDLNEDKQKIVNKLTE